MNDVPLHNNVPPEFETSLTAALAPNRAKTASKRVRWGILANIAAFLGLAGVALSAVLTFSTERTSVEASTRSAKNGQAALALKIDRLQSDLKALRKQVSSHPNPRGSVPDFALLEERVTTLENAQASINGFIEDTPDKVLSLPMVRRDLEDIKTDDDKAIDDLRREIDKVYDLNKWIIGGIGVGVLSLTVGQFFRRKERELPDNR